MFRMFAHCTPRVSGRRSWRSGRRSGDGHRRRPGPPPSTSISTRPLQPGKLAQAQAAMADFRAEPHDLRTSTSRPSRATGPGASAAAPRTCATPRSAASPRSAGPAAATRWSATARSCRSATTTAMHWGRYNTESSAAAAGARRRQLARQQRQPRHQVADRRARRVQHARLLRDRRRRRRRQVLDQGRQTLFSDLADGSGSRTATSTSCGSCCPRRSDQPDRPAHATTSTTTASASTARSSGRSPRCRAAGRGAAAAGAGALAGLRRRRSARA